MNLIVKLQPLFIIVSALLGLILGYTTPLGNFSVNLIEPFLMVLLQGRSLRLYAHVLD